MDPVTKELCKEKHRSINLELRDIKADVSTIKTRAWQLILLLGAQVLAGIALIIKGCAI